MGRGKSARVDRPVLRASLNSVQAQIEIYTLTRTRLSSASDTRPRARGGGTVVLCRVLKALKLSSSHSQSKVVLRVRYQGTSSQHPHNTPANAPALYFK